MGGCETAVSTPSVESWHRKHHASDHFYEAFCSLVDRSVTGCKAVIGIAHDVTAQVQQREVLAQSEQRHRALLDLVGVGALTLASENHCITSCRYQGDPVAALWCHFIHRGRSLGSR